MSRKLYRECYIPGVLVVLLMLVVSFFIRVGDFEKVPPAPNMEASYHVILTMSALKESPIVNHWFLPTVSLGGTLDKNIPWGATIPTSTGDYVYTSFASSGFLAPYFTFSALNIEFSLENLAKFNFVIGALSALIIYTWLSQLLFFCGFRKWSAVSGGVVGAAVAIFSREALLSHGVLYWVHSFYQIILVLSLFVFFKYLSSENERASRVYGWILVGLAFWGASTEWTGYVFNAGIFFILLFDRLKVPFSKALAVKVFIATFFAGILTIVHYGVVTGFESSINSFIARFFARNTSTGSLYSLFEGYALSYGLFLLVVAVFFPVVAFFSAKKDVRLAVFWSLLVAASVPLIENLVMLQHAQEFSFDRLKMLLPIAMILSFYFAWLDTKWRSVLLVLILASAVYGFYSYKVYNERYSAWSAMDAENQDLKVLVLKEVDIDCAVLSSNTRVRAYANLLFHRGIYESSSDLVVKDDAVDSCASVHLTASVPFVDLPEYLSALVWKEGEYAVRFDKEGGVWKRTEVRLASDSILAADLSDANWKKGISTAFSGLVIANTVSNRVSIAVGNYLIFGGAKGRLITNITYTGPYMNVFVEGGIINSDIAGYPNKIHVVKKL